MWWFCSFVYIDNVVYSLYSFYVLSKGNEIYERLVCIKAYVVCRRFSKPSRISSLILNTDIDILRRFLIFDKQQQIFNIDILHHGAARNMKRCSVLAQTNRKLKIFRPYHPYDSYGW